MLLKYFLLLVALGYANAAAIATVNCSGLIISDPNFATCQVAGAIASAGAGAPFVGASIFSADVFVDAEVLESPEFATAQASVSFTYVFTVTGGTGGGFFLPCLNAASDFPGGALASASFAGYGVGGDSRNSTNLCRTEGFSSASPFDYGVGQQFLLQLTASTPGLPRFQTSSDAGIGQDGRSFAFWDAQGNPLSNVTFTLTEVPEPASFALLLAGLLALWALKKH